MKPDLRMVGVVATFALAAILMAVVVSEPDRRVASLNTYRQRAAAQAVEIYVQNCVNCHGVAGEGIDPHPPLNDLRGKNEDVLYRVIERGRFGTEMVGFAITEGGNLTKPQIESLIALINHGSWEAVSRRAAQLNIAASWTPTPLPSATPQPSQAPILSTVTQTPNVPPVIEILPTGTPRAPVIEILPTGTSRAPVIEILPTGTPRAPVIEILPTASRTAPPLFEVIPTAQSPLFEIVATPTARP